MTTYTISGNTYAHRDAIRRTGATWDAANKRWLLQVREHGMRRNDSAIYELRRLSGLSVTAVA